MTHSIIKRYIALLLSLMIFVSSTPLQTFAQDGQSHTPSIGIINTLFSERDDTECKYKVTLYKEYKDGEWVNTKVNGQDVTMTIPNFGAETMVLTKEFGQEVPMYDERGRRIQYRIVQTYVTRTDYGFTGFYDEVVYNQEEPTIITLHNNDTDGDKHAVTITPPLPTDQTYTYDFEYRLTGEYDIYIEKVWDDKKIPIIRRNIP